MPTKFKRAQETSVMISEIIEKDNKSKKKGMGWCNICPECDKKRTGCVFAFAFFFIPFYLIAATAFFVYENVMIDRAHVQLKEFLYQHPEIKIQINSKGTIYDKHSSTNELRTLDLCYNEEIIFFINGIKHAFLLKTGTKNIANRFILDYSKRSKILRINEIKKGEEQMSLSIGTWILLVVVMVIVAKFAHKVSLRTIFRPLKKTTKRVKKEWYES